MRALYKLLLPAILCMSPGAHAQAREPTSALDWRTFVVPAFGTRIDYPAGVFVPAGNPEKGMGQRFDSSDGTFLSVYSRPNEAGETPASYLHHNLRNDQSALGLRAGHPFVFRDFSGTRRIDLL